MNKLNTLLTASVIGAMASQAQAAEIDVAVQNLTQGMYFTEILVTTSPADTGLFELGAPATPELQMMAEGGNIEGLAMVMEAAGAGIGMLVEGENGLTVPGMKRVFTLNTSETNTTLSITAMMLPTNDGFIGLDNWTVPETAGTYTLYLNAYDAGTEANDELRGSGMPGVAGMPVPPPLQDVVGTNGTGVTMEDDANTNVHIHRGNVGDDSDVEGKSDVSVVQRWLNPVAKVTVTVK